jgi:hypothetical protein
MFWSFASGLTEAATVLPPRLIVSQGDQCSTEYANINRILWIRRPAWSYFSALETGGVHVKDLRSTHRSPKNEWFY